MWPIITEIFSFSSTVFPAIRTTQLFYKTGRIMNSTNPVSLATNVTLTVVECCTPPPLRLASQCLSIVTLLGASSVSPNPATIGCTVSMVSDLYFKCLE
jgi:hypothetical protein